MIQEKAAFDHFLILSALNHLSMRWRRRLQTNSRVLEPILLQLLDVVLLPRLLLGNDVGKVSYLTCFDVPRHWQVLLLLLCRHNMWLHDMMPAHWFLTSSALKSFHQGGEVLWEPFGQLCQPLRCKPCQNFCIFLFPCWHSVSTTHPPTRLQCHLVAQPSLTLNPWSEFFSPEPGTSVILTSGYHQRHKFKQLQQHKYTNILHYKKITFRRRKNRNHLHNNQLCSFLFWSFPLDHTRRWPSPYNHIRRFSQLNWF